MSTIVMKDEIEQVFDALYCSVMGNARYHFAVIDRAAIADILKASVDDQRVHIWAWANRVYIANQCAYILTYAHRGDCDRNIGFISDADRCHHGGELIQNPGRFYRRLQSIQYNLYSNGGQVMLCREDMERLDNLIAVIAEQMIGDYQRGKVKT